MKKFILVNLEDEESKKLAEVISNKTCRKILDYLSEKNESESEIAKQLKIPISTVHYNIQLLVKSNLIKIKDFYWSDKGNKVNVYEVAKKAIIIAPKSSRSMRSKLKSIFSVILISTIAIGIINLILKNIIGGISGTGIQIYSSISTEEAVKTSEIIAPHVLPTNSMIIISNYIFWSLLVILFILVIYFLWDWRFKRK